VLRSYQAECAAPLNRRHSRHEDPWLARVTRTIRRLPPIEPSGCVDLDAPPSYTELRQPTIPALSMMSPTQGLYDRQESL
jgi:hypothetical protein